MRTSGEPRQTRLDGVRIADQPSHLPHPPRRPAASHRRPSQTARRRQLINLTTGRTNSFNKYLSIGARATRQSLKEDVRVKIDQRVQSNLRYQEWQDGKAGDNVGPSFRAVHSSPSARVAMSIVARGPVSVLLCPPGDSG